ncbi:MAG: SDR family oxidoreductase [Lentisphaeraceae bacterium]|nr:SDR family oxidoreductase [Lentisphaeraceae bacterium]
MRLNNKIAVVTGGGSGIGRAIAQRFAREGAQVSILDFNIDQGLESIDLIKQEGGEASFFHCDVSSSESVRNAFESSRLEYGDADILVNNAGVSHVGTLATTSEDDLDRLYNVNIKGVYLCLQERVKQMKIGGSIVNMASVLAMNGVPDRFAYSMSKGAVYMMTLSVAADFVSSGIRCNCISPARVHTPFVDDYLAKNYPGQEQEMFDKLAKTAPIGRMAQPEELASMALYLASDESAFVTGSNFQIDGGFVNLKV